MTPDRKRSLLEAYGADPARWPQDEMDPNAASGGADAADLERIEAEAGRLDGLLSLYTVETASQGFKTALKDIPRQAVDIRDAGKATRPASRPVWSLFGGLRTVGPQLAGLAAAQALLNIFTISSKGLGLL